jgi:sugar-specific transcriptional regulator TrmB
LSKDGSELRAERITKSEATFEVTVISMEPSNTEEDTSLREALAVIGLSDTEISTYLALLAQGEATTRVVAKDTDVTQRAVYNIAERLAERGLVRVNDHASPTTIRALSPEDSITSITDQLKSIQPTLETRFTETTPQAPEIQMVGSRNTALKRLRAAISTAEHEIILAVPKHTHPDIETELQAAIEREVFVLLLLGDTDASEEKGSKFAHSADIVRCWEERLPFLYVADDTSAMIGDPALLSSNHASGEAVVVSQRDLADSILGYYLSGFWPPSTEIFVADPASLPKTFEWFRQALFHVMLHHQEGTDLWADVETTDNTEIAGPVTQIRQALVEPATSQFALEASLYVETGGGEVGIGGWGSFAEDYVATSVTLRRDA